MPFQINFGGELLNDLFFKVLRESLAAFSGGKADDLDGLKQRIQIMANRVSMDALAVHCIQKMAEKSGQVSGECLSLAKVFEVKEALGM